VRPICLVYTYSLANQDGTPFDASVFTFDIVTRVFKVFTSDKAKIGTYNLRLTGYLHEVFITAHMDFTVLVKDSCEKVVITKAAD
jgi:hypothetical protein